MHFTGKTSSVNDEPLLLAGGGGTPINYIEDITRQREDMNNLFLIGKKYCFLPQEDKIHIFKPRCNFLFII